MSRDDVIAALREHKQELRAAGVVSLSVFGSTARGDADPDSDVDVAVRLADDFSRGGFDYFGRLEELEERLSRILGCKVDVVEEPVRKAGFQRQIDTDRALAF
jgi:predicted nucleotidyltransferase